MFSNVHCTIPQGVDRQTSKESNQFIQTILEEERRVKALHAQEIQSTAENPRIRQQNETREISAELRSQKHEQFLQERRRLQLRENSQELRQLEIQLRAAHVSKQLAEQKSALERQKAEQLRTKRQEDMEYEKERLATQEVLRDQELNERKKKEAFRSVLQSQMAETQQRRLKEYEEVLRDRDNMQQLLRRIELEHAAELKELEVRKEHAKKEMHDFVISQERYKLKLRSQKVDEHERFLQIREEREEKQRRLADEKRKERERKQLLSEQIGEQLFAHESEKHRREDLLLDLLVEERKTKEDFRFRQNLEKQVQQRIQVRQELENYRQGILLYKQERQREEDEKMIAEQAKINAEQDRVAKLKEDLRRNKVQEHGRAIQQMIEMKRHQRSVDAAETLRDYEILLNEQRKRQQQIEEERLRMLCNESPDVLRYLPVGVIRESDRELLDLTQSKEANGPKTLKK